MQKEDQNQHIVFVGESGFPVGFAAIQRLTLMARAFIHSGCRATVVCRKGVGMKSEKINFPRKGNFEGIDYSYTSKDVFKPEGFMERNWQKLIGMYEEYKLLRKLKRQNEIDLVIVSEMNAFHMLRYLLFSKFLNFPIVVNFVEMASSMVHRTTFLLRINDYLIDNWVIKLFDGALPISDKLLEYYNKIAPSKPSIKLPILCDYNKFEIPRRKGDDYFLYCGSIGYRPVIDFIVKAYKKVSTNEKIKLYMIVSGGSKTDVKSLEDELNNLFKDQRIKVFSNIPYKQLVSLYVNAKAMLIPLRSTVQDESRFPHKIGEYLASGNPVITTKVGEIKNYFEDGHTALIADKYDRKSFAEKMQFALDHPELCKKIGLNGKELGLKEFDYKIHGTRLQKYMRRFSTE